MEKCAQDRITHEDPIPLTLNLLTQGYLLRCRCEGKSPKTITTYEEHLRRLVWYCRKQNFPDEPQKVAVHHVRSFIWYVGSESNRWGTGDPAPRNPAGRSTMNHYYWVLHAFFGWLKQEGFIADQGANPQGMWSGSEGEKVVEASLNM